MENMKSYREQIFKILDPEKTEFRYNSEWLSPLNAEEIIDLASNITVARLLERDDFEKRYSQEEPISLHELLYPLFQAYDSVQVKADVEIGGTDQRWNHLLGRELQRSSGQDPQVVFLMPILEGINGGDKMSKSLGNYVGIEEEPGEQFGKLMSIPDYLIPQYYRLCLHYDSEEMNEIQKRIDSGENPMKLKMELAEGIVKLYHSPEEAENAKEEFVRVFSENQEPEEMDEFTVKKDKEIWIVELLDKAGLVESRGEARRLIKQGALRINGDKIKDITLNLSFKEETVIKLGKRRFLKVIPEK